LIPITVPSRKLLCGAPLAAAALIALCAAGCVQRRMTVRSNPPGAFLYVDNYPIGTTPVSTDFTYYGKRQFRLVRDGYETLTVEQRIWPPWYEWFGIDFVSENLIPYTFRDERQLSFQMIPQQIPPSPQLAARAEELRASSQAQRYVPPPALPPSQQVPAGALPPPQQPPPGVLPPPTGQPAYVLPPQAVPPAGPPATRVPPPATGQPSYPVSPPGAPYAPGDIRVLPPILPPPVQGVPQPGPFMAP
jgi:hypothetical protein